MLKTFFRPLLGLVLLVFIGAPVIGQDGSRDVNLLSPAERQWLKEHPVIRHAPDPDYAPLEFFDEHNQPIGIAVDYLELIGERLGVRFESTFSSSWAASLESVRQRQADLVTVAARTATRSEYMLFTSPYITLPDVILVREQIQGVQTMEDLSGKVVTAIEGWATIDWIREHYPEVQLKMVPDVETALREVAFGSADATILGLATASYGIERTQITNLRVAGETGYEYELSFATRKDWPILNQIMEKGLASITEEEREGILRKWISIGPETTYDYQRYWIVFIVGLAVVLLILMGILAWNRSLKRQVEQRTAQLQKELVERKRAEERLSLLSSGVEQSSEGIALSDLAGNLIFANHAFAAMHGYRLEDVIGKHLSIFHIPDQMPSVEAANRQIQESGEFNGEIWHARRDGTVFPAFMHNSLLRDQSGTPIGMIATLRDITDRKRAEEALRMSEERFRSIFENATIGLYRTTPDGRILMANPVLVRMLGYSSFEELVERNLEKSGYEPDYPRAAFKSQIESHGEVIGLESAWVRKDGTTLFVRESAKTIHDEAGNPLYYEGTVEDITERKLMEEELVKAEKLESIGVLAGGIAHDFNNILTAILGNVSLAKMDVEQGTELFELLDEAQKASKRAKGLTRQLLTFSKGGTPILKPVSIKEVIQDSVGFALSGSNVKCELSIPDSLRPVEIDEDQIGQVINNLVINADQAMPGGGIIRIICENTSIGETSDMPLEPGEYVRIIIEDLGAGIAEEHLPRVFDPFFTTKQTGSGLGLSTTYSIVANHKGHIQIKSQVGVGTTFFIYLPASEKKSGSRPPIGEKARPGSGRILVLDDEEAVRKFADATLTKFGYDVSVAGNESEAIEFYQKAQQSGKPFNAIIMDLTIPGDTGVKETIQKFHQINPHVKAIVSSGYSNDPIMANFRMYGFCGRVVKPYQASELANVLHEVLTVSDNPTEPD